MLFMICKYFFILCKALQWSLDERKPPIAVKRKHATSCSLGWTELLFPGGETRMPDILEKGRWGTVSAEGKSENSQSAGSQDTRWGLLRVCLHLRWLLPQRGSWFSCPFYWGHDHSYSQSKGFLLTQNQSLEIHWHIQLKPWSFRYFEMTDETEQCDLVFWALRLGLSWILTWGDQIIMSLWITYFRRDLPKKKF